jgi:hypothetical protein
MWREDEIEARRGEEEKTKISVVYTMWLDSTYPLIIDDDNLDNLSIPPKLIFQIPFPRPDGQPEYP